LKKKRMKYNNNLQKEEYNSYIKIRTYYKCGGIGHTANIYPSRKNITNSSNQLRIKRDSFQYSQGTYQNNQGCGYGWGWFNLRKGRRNT